MERRGTRQVAIGTGSVQCAGTASMLHDLHLFSTGDLRVSESGVQRDSVDDIAEQVGRMKFVKYVVRESQPDATR
jgi:hypothetical protein